MQFVNQIIIIGLMIIFNAFFAAYEMALASISRSKLTYLVQTKRKGATEALFMKDRMEASLAVVQVGITFVGAIAAATGGAGITELLNPIFRQQFGVSENVAEFFSLIILIVPLSILTIIFAELIPKTYALKNSEWVVLRLSGIMKYFALIAYPIISTLENTVKSIIKFIEKKAPTSTQPYDSQSGLHELTAALSLARGSRLINAQQEKIVMSAAQLSFRHIKDIMIPINEMSIIHSHISLSDALIRAHLDMHTRFPVSDVENDHQSIQGYINFKDIIAALRINPEEPTIRGIIRPIKKFPDSTVISKVLERMIQEKLHIALVEDPEAKVIGMVTQEDIIEELVGEIEDEFDRLPNHIHPYGNQWLIGGAVPMSVISRTLGIPWDPKDEDLKLADWCQRRATKPFTGGEFIPGKGFQITVRKLKRKKIGEAFVSKTF